MTYYTQTNMMDMVEDIIDLDSKMRFAAVIDSKGKILEAIMKSGKLSLKSQKEEENFCAQVAARKKMREKFDKSLGKVRYVHVEREKVTQMVIYTKKYSVYFTMEPEMSISDKIRIVTKIKKMTSAL